MIKITIYNGSLATKDFPVESRAVKVLTCDRALKEELISRLCWGTRIYELSPERVVVECPDAAPTEYVVFEDMGDEDALEPIYNVAEWYAQATLLCSESVFELLRAEIQHARSLPFAPY